MRDFLTTIRPSVVKVVVGLGFCISAISSADAGDLEWSGLYRVEAYAISASEVNSSSGNKDYGLHHLILRPKIVASDGIDIIGRFDIINSSDSTLANSQVGGFFGDGLNNSGSTASTGDQSNTLGEKQAAEELEITQLYMTYTHEFGSLIVGRAPLHFGLGMTHNAGDGEFDHWYDTRDLLAYKLVLGNLTVTPMYAKLVENSLSKNIDDVNEYSVQLIYDNPDSDLAMGVMYQARRSGSQGNDTPASDTGIGGGSGTPSASREAIEVDQFNLHIERRGEEFRVGIEGAFADGKYGVISGDGADVTFGGSGVALEAEYFPKNSSYTWGLNAGYAQGDDASSGGEFEGFLFDRNYDVATLLFNHELGSQDLLGTAFFRGDQQSSNSRVDVEAITNAYYLSPYVTVKWSDKWNTRVRIVTGSLIEDRVGGDTDLGYEVDVSLTYKPTDRITWHNEVAYFMPGSAFELGTGESTNTVLGLITKVAISF